jgi:Skp family chaperone for outer membrane proteins
MKKQVLFIGLLVVMSLLLVGNFSWAATTSQNIGLIDVEKLFNAHPNTQKIIDLERQFVEEKQKRQQDLNEKGKGKTREEVRELEDQMNIEWAPVIKMFHGVHTL